MTNTNVTVATFDKLKIEYDKSHKNDNEVSCFLPVHTTVGKIEKSLFKKNGELNEQYYKWQFLTCFIESGLCSKDFIGTEVNFPKGNKGAAMIKLDAAVFDDKNWFSHYIALHTKKDDSKWDELNWLKEHLLCAIEFKKEDSKDIKGVFTSQLKTYMNESAKNIVFGILYDEGRLYLFKSNGKNYSRLSDEFNIENKGKIQPTYDIPDGYINLLSFEQMLNYDMANQTIIDYSKRKLEDLSVISKTDSKRIIPSGLHLVLSKRKARQLSRAFTIQAVMYSPSTSRVINEILSINSSSISLPSLSLFNCSRTSVSRSYTAL